MLPRPILSQVDELLSSLKQLMPTIYQKETLESVLGLFLNSQGNAVPHHCQTKSESAITRISHKISLTYQNPYLLKVIQNKVFNSVLFFLSLLSRVKCLLYKIFSD
ncbi:MAG: hypothetical protein F6K22_37470 [Okeania sp. SIO2F4]|uniref:hypothetical protein n=1 Tax=Okeania sp. SIO2F4 TaxID=2607790 RepID=UPI00142927FF|nr:hypothetical protein [Okeania sp. SIO2F4]NES07978.1 hypothetical protein [Okeania sp. SIO2F4]